MFFDVWFSLRSNRHHWYDDGVKILLTRFPLESRLGGAERQTVSLMEGLMAQGHAVAFAGSCPTLLSLCRERHIPAVEWHIGKPPVTPWLAVSFLWRRMFMRRKLAKLLQQFRDVDALCMLSLSEKLLLTESAARQGKKVLWIEHDRIGKWLRKNPWLGTLRRQSRSARIVTVSDMSKGLMEDIGFDGGRITAIPNGVDASRFADGQRTPHEGVHIGCVARLTRDKGVDVLLAAMRDTPHIRLTIVGDGPEKPALLWYAREYFAAGQVLFVKQHENLNAFYRSIDVLVLPSRDNDPFGMAAAEAMFCGTPVIVTDQCGIAGYLENGEDSLMVPANDAPALASALRRMTDQSTHNAIGEHGKKTAAERFSLAAMVAGYAALLR